MTLPRPLRDRVAAAHDAVEQQAADLARAIYDQPELSMQEFSAHEMSTGLLRSNGFDIATVNDIPTAFVATIDSGRPGPEIGLLAEYDALPEIGHACGHHLIAGSAVSAAMALRAVLPEIGGSVKVFGCPAEETGVGKNAMLAAGVFDSTSAALTFHAYHSSSVMVSCNGVRQVALQFAGKASHASEAPWDGLSALDGVLLTFQNVSVLRQFIRDGSRVHGIITDGGQAANIIPEHASCVIAVRSTDPAELEHLHLRVRECAEAAALASGTQVRIGALPGTDPVRKSALVDGVVRGSFTAVGEAVGDWPALAATDFGNVSQRIPSALFSVATWPRSVAFHSRDATEHAGLQPAFDAMALGGKIMAIAATELLLSTEAVSVESERFAGGLTAPPSASGNGA